MDIGHRQALTRKGCLRVLNVRFACPPKWRGGWPRHVFPRHALSFVPALTVNIHQYEQITAFVKRFVRQKACEQNGRILHNRIRPFGAGLVVEDKTTAPPRVALRFRQRGGRSRAERRKIDGAGGSQPIIANGLEETTWVP
jgi:hypothetical protein